MYNINVISQADFEKMQYISNRDARLKANRELKRIQKREAIIKNVIGISAIFTSYIFINVIANLIEKM